jgi:hypothetical protein
MDGRAVRVRVERPGAHVGTMEASPATLSR